MMQGPLEAIPNNFYEQSSDPEGESRSVCLSWMLGKQFVNDLLRSGFRQVKIDGVWARFYRSNDPKNNYSLKPGYRHCDPLQLRSDEQEWLGIHTRLMSEEETNSFLEQNEDYRVALVDYEDANFTSDNFERDYLINHMYYRDDKEKVFYRFVQNICVCPEPLISEISMVLANLKLRCCERCVPEDKFLSVLDARFANNKDNFLIKMGKFISDLFLIFSGDPDKEQLTQTKWASEFKMFLERSRSEQALRRLIHCLGAEGTRLHQLFNMKNGDAATVFPWKLAILGVIRSIIAFFQPNACY